MIRFNALLFSTCLLVYHFTPASAQSLPTIQVQSLSAPAGIKIDGKATEWSNDFQAYNNHVEVFYTLSNDANNLYLAVRSANSAITSKILRGGLTLTVSSAPFEEKQTPVRITYPVPAADGMRQLMLLAINYPNKTPGIEYIFATSFKESDSLLLVKNKTVLESAKDVYVSGVKSIPDSLISIYNDFGVMVRASLENNEQYICEMAIPLKYLGLTSSSKKELYYSIILNPPHAAMLQNRVTYENFSIGRGYKRHDLRHLGSKTDFKAVYSLAGK